MNTDDILKVDRKLDAWELHRRMLAMGAPQAPLYEAAARGFIRLRNQLHPSAPWPPGLDNSRPTVLVINDDPGPGEAIQSLGPKGWLCASRLKNWAMAALIHGAAGTPEEYNLAVANAMLALRVVVVETASEYARAWHEAIQCPNTLLVLPKLGPHPLNNRVLH